MNELGNVIEVMQMLWNDGYKAEDGLKAGKGVCAWTKVSGGVLHFIPLTKEILNVLDNDNMETIYAYEIRVKQENDMWRLDWDEYCDGHSIYCKTLWSTALAVEMLFTHWEVEYGTFGNKYNVGTAVRYFEAVVENIK